VTTVEFDRLPSFVRQSFVALAAKAGQGVGFRERAPLGLGLLVFAIPASAVLSYFLYVTTGFSGTGLGVIAVFVALWLRKRYLGPPWRKGFYLFPGVIVDAHTPSLRLYDLPPLGSGLFLVQRHRKNGGYLSWVIEARIPGLKHHVLFDCPNGEEAAQAAWKQFLEQHGWAQHARRAQNWSYLAGLDPFAWCAATGTWTSPVPDASEPIARPAGKASLAACFALGLLVALPGLTRKKDDTARPPSAATAVATAAGPSWDTLAATPDAARFLAAVEKQGKLGFSLAAGETTGVDAQANRLAEGRDVARWSSQTLASIRHEEQLSAQLAGRLSGRIDVVPRNEAEATLTLRLVPREVLAVAEVRGELCPLTAFTLELDGRAPDGVRLLTKLELPAPKAADLAAKSSCLGGQLEDLSWHAARFGALFAARQPTAGPPGLGHPPLRQDGVPRRGGRARRLRRAARRGSARGGEHMGGGAARGARGGRPAPRGSAGFLCQ
jgi:hypothetical protein